MSNIWTAAGEGNLDRVTELVQQGKSLVSILPTPRPPQLPHHTATIPPTPPDRPSFRTSPNALDENAYSPLHAAASWGHSDILRFLVASGGDINLADGDGDTPLYVVESVGMAKLVVELGGDARHTNEEGLTPAAALEEEYPHIALYLRTLTGEPSPSSSAALAASAPSGAPSAQPQPNLDAPTDALMLSVRAIMERAERGELSEQETDDALRAVVEQAVGGQLEAGRAIGEQMLESEAGDAAGTRARTADEMAGEQGSAKRSRDGDDVGR
ncbi:hypothetical protein JCM10450v2_002289 [Rhodotorula kratochvilovae]